MNKSFVFLVLLANLFMVPQLSADALTIDNAWVREAPPVSKVQAAYMVLHNNSERDITLISASSPLFARVEFHRTVADKAVMRMEQEKTLSIPAGSSLQLQPDGRHMMLFNPKQALKAGDKVPFSLTFADQNQLQVILVVKKAAGMMHHHHE
ncbi:copper chaperone PCu(A)C [Sulfuriflexus sp.]|uniref:copper chaperone PCu(A)C n=1 Tax=Sulfuriflexus sp. TaxID=2015443 RepID=UPI0028CEB24D|nr:copper chaperone PCu(A)C [Sulfuriflexus sp.]MDT8405492.1 copper chaperone PCu(A)C [Sulfuriflexus sp.]